MKESVGVKKDVELSSRQEYLDSFFSLISETMNYMTSQNLELAINSLEKALKRVKKNEEAERARIERGKREKEQQKKTGGIKESRGREKKLKGWRIFMSRRSQVWIFQMIGPTVSLMTKSYPLPLSMKLLITPSRKLVMSTSSILQPLQERVSTMLYLLSLNSSSRILRHGMSVSIKAGK